MAHAIVAVVFCPVSDPNVYKKKNEGVDLDLYQKILCDLEDLNFQGKILFSAFSEPMLHRGIYDLMKMTKDKLPLSRLEIVSNGDLIKTDRMKKLFDSGLDTVSLSLYDGPHQMTFFQGMMKELGLTDKQVVLRRRYKENGNWGMVISNRTGIVNSNLYRDENEEEVVTLPLKKNCFYPFYQMVIDYNGDVLLCAHDWKKKFVAGNVKNEHLWDIWRGKKYNFVREKLHCSNRGFAPCNTCDVKGDVMGRESYEHWKNLNEQ